MHRLVVTVVIPAYNEEKTVGNVISETISVMDEMGMPYEVIVVDDGSTDKTGLIASNNKVTLLSNQNNRGKGYSLRKAFQQAQGEIIVTIDSDGEHKPKEIPDLIDPLLNGTDIVSGSRFMGSNTQVTTNLNRLGNFMFNNAIMALTKACNRQPDRLQSHKTQRSGRPPFGIRRLRNRNRNNRKRA